LDNGKSFIVVAAAPFAFQPDHAPPVRRRSIAGAASGPPGSFAGMRHEGAIMQRMILMQVKGNSFFGE
jgi:hypothetical protein